MRNQETGFLLRLFCAKSFTFNFLRFAGYISTAVIFFVKSAQEEELKAGPAFAIFACFNFMSIIVGVFTGHGVGRDRCIHRFRSRTNPKRNRIHTSCHSIVVDIGELKLSNVEI